MKRKRQKRPKSFKYSKTQCDVCSTGNYPNSRAVLRVFKAGSDTLLATIELGGFCECAQMFYEGYLQHDLGLPRASDEFRRLLKRGRKGLGYSYP